MKLTLEERFWSKVNKTLSCWIWTARVDKDGYGKEWIVIFTEHYGYHVFDSEDLYEWQEYKFVRKKRKLKDLNVGVAEPYVIPFG